MVLLPTKDQDFQQDRPLRQSMEHKPCSKAFRASTALLTPWPWTSSLRSGEGIRSWGFKHSHSPWCFVTAALEKEHTFRLQGQKARTGTRTRKERRAERLSPQSGPPSLAGWAAEPGFEKWSLLPARLSEAGRPPLLLTWHHKNN